MSQHKNGNKEAKKPKREPVKAPAAGQLLPPVPVVAAHSAKKK